jgi:DNA polymerase III beta subunit
MKMLKAQISSDDLISGLVIATSVAGKFNSMPYLESVKLHADESGTLSLHSTDLHVTYQDSFPAVVESGGECLVSAALLHSMVKNFPDKDVNLESLEGDILRVRIGSFKTELSCVISDTFPVINWEAENEKIIITCAELADAIAKTIVTLAVGNQNWNLAGIHLKSNKGKLVLESTDNNRLSYVETSAVASTDFFGEKPLIGERKSMLDLKRLCEKYPDETAVLKITKCGKLRISVGSSEMAITPLAGKFPDTDRLMPDESLCGKNYIEIDRNQLKNVLKKVKPIYDKYRCVQLDFKWSQMFVKTENKNNATAEDVVDHIVCKGDDLSVMIDGLHLEQVLNVMSCNRLKIDLMDGTKPILVTSLDDKDQGYKCLLAIIVKNEAN